jgi:hypothetical protein
MAYKLTGTQVDLDPNNPYLWGSKDTTTVPSNEIVISTSSITTDNKTGSDVAVGCGKIVVGQRGYSNERGRAYVYDLDGTNELIIESPVTSNDFFGESVAIGHGKIVVGAPGNDTLASGAGAAYIFDLDGTNQIKLTASNGGTSDGFGRRVDIGSGKIAITGSSAGAGYLYDMDGTNEIILESPVSESFSQADIAIGNGRVVLGNRSGNSFQGTAYVYDLQGNYLFTLNASDAASSDNYGTSVAIGSGKIVIGATGDDDNGSSSGSAYIYNLDGSGEIKITGNANTSSALLGDYGLIDVGCGRIIVGSRRDTSFNGRAYIFDLNGNPITNFTASGFGIDAEFTSGGVAIGDGKIVIGSQGINDSGTDEGRAFVYDTPLVYTVWDAIDLQYG